MNDKELKDFLESLEKRYYKIYNEEDYVLFKRNAERFFDLFKEFGGPKVVNINKKGLKKFLTDELISRIFLGIGCELIVKSVYLKRRYLINQVSNLSKNKKLSFPYPIKDVPKDSIITEVYGFKKLNSNLYKLVPEKVDYKTYNRLVRKGLEIARVWRNKEAHFGGGYHTESMEIYDIRNSLSNVYKIFFNEEYNLLEKR